METTAFIYETSNGRFQRFVALTLVVIILYAGIWLRIASLGSDVGWYDSLVPDIVGNITPFRLFIIAILGATILIPLPTELAFYLSISQGNAVLVCIILAVAGSVVGNAFNYLLGLLLSKYVLYFLSAKSFFKARRTLNHWGPYAILLFSMLPAPNDILAVGLGTMKYNAKRLFMLVAVGNTIKFMVVALIGGALLAMIRGA